jgi:hypothetical protein
MPSRPGRPRCRTATEPDASLVSTFLGIPFPPQADRGPRQLMSLMRQLCLFQSDGLILSANGSF